MPKVAILGAGSAFTSHLAKGILPIPDIGDGTAQPHRAPPAQS